MHPYIILNNKAFKLLIRLHDTVCRLSKSPYPVCYVNIVAYCLFKKALTTFATTKVNYGTFRFFLSLCITPATVSLVFLSVISTAITGAFSLPESIFVFFKLNN